MEEQQGKPRRWVAGKISGLGAGLRNLLGAFRGCFVPRGTPYHEMDPEQELDWDYLQVPDMDSSRSLQAQR